MATASEKLVRKYRKKLRQVEHLETSKRPLTSEEHAKVSKKEEIRQELQTLLQTLNSKDCESSWKQHTEQEEEEGNNSEDFKPEYSVKDTAMKRPMDYGDTKEDDDDEEEEAQNLNNESKRSRLDENSQNSGQEPSEPEDDRPSASFSSQPRDRSSRDSPSPGPRTSSPAGERRSRGRFKHRMPPKPRDPYYIPPSSPVLTRPLVLPAQPSAPPLPPDEERASLYRRIKKAKFSVRELKGHSDIVWSVAVDGNLVVSASRDTTLRVWNAHVGEELGSLRGHTDSVNGVILLSADQTDKLVSRLNHQGTYRIAVSGSSDCTIKVWSVLDGQMIKSIYTYNAITSVGVLSSDCHIVVGTEGGKIEVWDVVNETVLSSIGSFDSSVSSLWIDGIFIFSSSSDGELRVWQFLENDLSLVYDAEDNLSDKRHINSIAVNGSRIFVGDDGANVKVLNWKTGKLDRLKNHLLEFGTTDAICILGSLLLCSSYDIYSGNASVNCRILPGGEYVGTLWTKDLQKILSIAAFNNDTGALRVVTGGIHLHVWDWDPHTNSGNFPTVFSQRLAGRATVSESEEESTEEADTNHTDDKARELALVPYTEKSWLQTWCTLM